MQCIQRVARILLGERDWRWRNGLSCYPAGNTLVLTDQGNPPKGDWPTTLRKTRAGTGTPDGSFGSFPTRLASASQSGTRRITEHDLSGYQEWCPLRGLLNDPSLGERGMTWRASALHAGDGFCLRRIGWRFPAMGRNADAQSSARNVPRISWNGPSRLLPRMGGTPDDVSCMQAHSSRIRLRDCRPLPESTSFLSAIPVHLRND